MEIVNPSSGARASAKPRRRAGRQVAVRLDADVIARLDALLPLLESPWRKARRSDVLRKVILSGLRELEEQAPPAASTRKAARRTPRNER